MKNRVLDRRFATSVAAFLVIVGSLAGCSSASDSACNDAFDELNPLEPTQQSLLMQDCCCVRPEDCLSFQETGVIQSYCRLASLGIDPSQLLLERPERIDPALTTKQWEDLPPIRGGSAEIHPKSAQRWRG